MKTINPREWKFITQSIAFCGKKSATQIAIDCGYGVAGARTRASELMARPEIRNEIEKGLEEIREKWSIDKDKHWRELGELRDMAKETKNVNAAVRAEELRGKVAGFYIDRQILASAKMVQLPDGTKKLEQDLTEQDLENLMQNILDKHDVPTALPNKKSRKKPKRPR